MKAKTILITGASSGIGAELASAYAKPGITLLLTGRNSERLQNITKKCIAKGATAINKIVDVNDAEEIKNWLLEQDQKIPIDLVIANAGIAKTNRENNFTSDSILFNTNIQGTLNTISPVIPLMQQRKHGQIAIMSSLRAFYGTASSTAYCASKAALLIYGQGLRAKLKEDGIGVSVICPGFVSTPLTANVQYKKPFEIKSTEAAKIIQRGLMKNKPLIAFPLQPFILLRILQIMPARLSDRIASTMNIFKKSSV